WARAYERTGKLLVLAQARTARNLCFRRAIPPVSVSGRTGMALQQSRHERPPNERCGQVQTRIVGHCGKAPHICRGYRQGGFLREPTVRIGLGAGSGNALSTALPPFGLNLGLNLGMWNSKNFFQSILKSRVFALGILGGMVRATHRLMHAPRMEC